MLTIFATPKAFKGHIGAIQRNAIRSWTLLQPRPEIILIGDDEGTERICADYGLRWVPRVERSQNRTPLVRSVFSLGQDHASYPVVCYTNADVVYASDFLNAVRRCVELLENQPFLLIGGRWDVELIPADILGFGCEAKLNAFLSRFGSFEGKLAMEYFVFPKHVLWDYPPFTIGRAGWDSWVVYQACKRGMPVVDIGHVITAIHQNHESQPFQAGKLAFYHHSPEDVQNLKLLGIKGRYWIEDAGYQLTPAGTLIEPPHPLLRHFRQRLLAVRIWFVYQLQHNCWPLFVLLRTMLRASRVAVRFVGLASR